MMITSFSDKTTEAIFHGTKNKDTRKIDPSLLVKVERKLDLLNAAAQLKDLKIPPGNRLEALSGNYSGFYSIRVDKQWRIIFKWSNNSAEQVEFVDYH